MAGKVGNQEKEGGSTGIVVASGRAVVVVVA